MLVDEYKGSNTSLNAALKEFLTIVYFVYHQMPCLLQASADMIHVFFHIDLFLVIVKTFTFW